MSAPTSASPDPIRCYATGEENVALGDGGIWDLGTGHLEPILAALEEAGGPEHLGREHADAIIIARCG